MSWYAPYALRERVVYASKQGALEESNSC